MERQKYEEGDKSKKLKTMVRRSLLRRDIRRKRKVKGTEPHEQKAGKLKKYAHEMAGTQKPTRES